MSNLTPADPWRDSTAGGIFGMNRANMLCLVADRWMLGWMAAVQRPIKLLPWLVLGACVRAATSEPTHPDAGVHPHAPEHADVSHVHHAHHGHHGHGAHRFRDAEAWAQRFEDPGRDAWQRPDIVIASLGLRPDSIVVDIGSASGYFPVRIASLVPEGRVWGVDIEATMVRSLNERARREGLANLFSILGTVSHPMVPEPVDVVLMVNTYHHIEKRSAYFRGLSSMLASGGRVVIVDFKMGDHPVGPPDAMKVGPEGVERELVAAGYRLRTRDDDSLPYQYVLTFSPVRAAPADADSATP
ncbi:MAG: class I SAM-dependent methyltransferase [Myxococcales bacterium]|nr:class I SAM-dependent methyltransferase [Myxococcales bacterium]